MADKIIESLLLLVVGMSCVIIVLFFLSFIIYTGKWIDETINQLRIHIYSKKIESGPAVDEINDELIAVLTAAVMTTYRKNIRIRKVKFLDHTSQPTWAVTGRLNVMASHLITKRK
jgi:sodium pump decarboxylase gamma subunit